MSSERGKMTDKRRKIAYTRGPYKKYTTGLRREILRLYQQQKMSCGEVAKKLSITISSVNRAIKDAEVARPRKEAQRAYYEKMKHMIMFTCKLCGKIKPLSDLIENRSYRPPIFGCEDCVK